METPPEMPQGTPPLWVSYVTVDDIEETVKKRLITYENETIPLIEFYRQQKILETLVSDGTITEMQGNSLIIDTPLEQDYLVGDNGMITNFFPVFTAVEKENIRIENVVIDGKMKPGSNLVIIMTASAGHYG